MRVIDTDIDGCRIIEPDVFADERGFFLETFQARRYAELVGIEEEFVQDNHSRSARHVLRGMHFQRNNPQGKLVRCVRGAVLDVAVDIRPGSASYGRWVATELDEENKRQFWLPPGLAHGFLVLSDTADFEYKCTAYYDPGDEGCLLWNDPDVGIEWPVADPVISARDRGGSRLRELAP